MLRVHFEAEDLFNVTFASEPLPLVELALALVAAQRTDEQAVFGRWRSLAAQQLPGRVRPLFDLLRPDGDNPHFVEPYARSLEEGLTVIRDRVPFLTPEGLTRAATRAPGSPSWLRALWSQDREAWDQLDTAIRSAYEVLIAPQWPRIRQSFQADVAWRTRLLAAHGIKACLASTHPAADWSGTVFEVGRPPDYEVRLGGRGLVLMPSPFWTGRPLLDDHPDGTYVLLYPAMTPLPLVSPERADGALDALLGRTRAAVLQLLIQQRTTSELARDLDISLPSVSEHTRTLRAAGLITTARDGKAVLHSATALGVDLLHSGA
ncbi:MULTISPECIES: helix-turn-helix domain-containing protein [unclassified Streptomyces]|uniref:ArsR/SmtB family transcription factor n=1 Tax=unclassified Streptomyces TaxID=2593676 RepID=UPI000DC7792D|nr:MULTISPECIES: helix-turn-helix domain-containing protein [unclassified Streptomyces]AWZ05666.1 ArsR family transcriptional regulator [Streptomyces sp. ICC4]AWZ13355.1 ArsR family transcriptional regulator [Streptomyces sp. ICC1]